MCFTERSSTTIYTYSFYISLMALVCLLTVFYCTHDNIILRFLFLFHFFTLTLFKMSSLSWCEVFISTVSKLDIHVHVLYTLSMCVCLFPVNLEVISSYIFKVTCMCLGKIQLYKTNQNQNVGTNYYQYMH